jgi:tripartite-type tricarboxylate transporter receptor subunit TctC
VGLPEYTVTTWYGLWAPKGTPADIQARVIDEVRKAVQTDELKAIWAAQGAEFPNLSQQQFASFIRAEITRWSAVVKASGAKLD